MFDRSVTLEIASTNYEADKEQVVSAMDSLQSLCDIHDGFLVSKPMDRFGWSFFKILIKYELLCAMNLKVADQIMRSDGKKIEEKFVSFLTKLFEDKNAKVKVKLVEY